jgi:hypothetical protein
MMIRAGQRSPDRSIAGVSRDQRTRIAVGSAKIEEETCRRSPCMYLSARVICYYKVQYLSGRSMHEVRGYGKLCKIDPYATTASRVFPFIQHS